MSVLCIVLSVLCIVLCVVLCVVLWCEALLCCDACGSVLRPSTASYSLRTNTPSSLLSLCSTMRLKGEEVEFTAERKVHPKTTY